MDIILYALNEIDVISICNCILFIVTHMLSKHYQTELEIQQNRFLATKKNAETIKP